MASLTARVEPAVNRGNDTTNGTPAAAAASAISRASRQVGAITFSVKIGLPARAAASITARWAVVAVVTTTPSIAGSASTSSRSVTNRAPSPSAAARPRAGAPSHTATTSVSGWRPASSA
jgi:hypothetical protein